jgi:hypothetical protein
MSNKPLNLDWVHDVKCPVCGTKASYKMTGKTSYVTVSCGHPESEKLIEERENQALSSL